MTEQTQTPPTTENTPPPSGDTQGGGSESLLNLNGDTPPAFDPKTKPEDEGMAAFWDDEKGEYKLEELINGYREADTRAKGLRDKLAKGEGKPPKEAGEYKAEIPEELKDSIPEDDPMVEALKPVAHKLGLTQAQYAGVVGEMGKWLKDNIGAIASGDNLSDEDKAAAREAQMKKIGDNPQAVIREVTEWTRALKQRGTFDDADIQEVEFLAATGEGVRLLNKMRIMTGGEDIPASARVTDGLPSDAEIYSMIGDEKYRTDESYRQKVQKLLEQREAAGRPPRLQV